MIRLGFRINREERIDEETRDGKTRENHELSDLKFWRKGEKGNISETFPSDSVIDRHYLLLDFYFCNTLVKTVSFQFHSNALRRFHTVLLIVALSVVRKRISSHSN